VGRACEESAEQLNEEITTMEFSFKGLLNLMADELFRPSGYNVDAVINNIQFAIVMICSNPFFG
jgi:hypothetical protein